MLQPRRLEPRRLAGALVALGCLASPASVRAHGAIRVEQSACVLKIGPDFMYFTGYQPGVSQEKFCEDIPATGDAIFVLDYAQDELRAMKADFRIIRRAGAADEDAAQLAALTVAYLPPKAYPSGTLNFEHMFKEAGEFVGIVTVDGPNGEHWVSRFPFSVGGHLFPERTPYYLLTAAALLALLLFLWGGDDKRGARAKPGR